MCVRFDAGSLKKMGGRKGKEGKHTHMYRTGYFTHSPKAISVMSDLQQSFKGNWSLQYLCRVMIPRFLHLCANLLNG